MRGQLHQHAHEITGKVLAVPVLSPESHFLKREFFLSQRNIIALHHFCVVSFIRLSEEPF